ncbi:aldo/keto reductase [Bombilactobacillus bombi]|uniref:aldo/keto reductase n=1 Tax=Bombilactobacillus bombi TaxID=1303590 RepID=UPI0015E62074|nr:aldo/keto reductase [Bombilactobacillus bombi]
MQIPTIKLNNGVTMPQLGLGVYQITDLNQCEQTVLTAINAGYRLIDTAAAYHNETAVGQAIKQTSVAREQLFITSKLWVADANYERAKRAINESLENLQLDYLDLYLMHQAYGDVAGAWRAMSEAYQEGKIRALGVSNFFPDQLKNLELMSNIQPVIDQIEVNPWYQRASDVQAIQRENVAVEAWAPFAEGQHEIFTNETLVQIGQKYHKSVGQVILRWLIQRGIVVLAKSVHQSRIEENSAVFDFELSDDDMQTIATLDKGESQFFDHRDPVTIEQIFGSSLAQLKE